MPRRRAFTLIELLVVIAILGVLGSLVVVAGASARARVRSARCQSDLRQIGAATHLYLGEHKNRLPSISHDRADDGRSLSWTRTLTPYLTPEFIGRCPAQSDHPAKVTYGWNDLLVTASGQGLPYSACRTPSATILLAENARSQTAEHLHFAGAARGVTPVFFRTLVNIECHGSAANYLFVDGHVAFLAWSEIENRLATRPSPLVNP